VLRTRGSRDRRGRRSRPRLLGFRWWPPDHPLGGLASDARHGGDQRDVAFRDGAHQRGELGSAEDPERGLGPDALDTDEQAEESQLVARDEAVEADGIGADAGVHVQGYFGVA
jgi:hypothetical protein